MKSLIWHKTEFWIASSVLNFGDLAWTIAFTETLGSPMKITFNFNILNLVIVWKNILDEKVELTEMRSSYLQWFISITTKSPGGHFCINCRLRKCIRLLELESESDYFTSQSIDALVKDLNPCIFLLEKDRLGSLSLAIAIYLEGKRKTRNSN